MSFVTVTEASFQSEVLESDVPVFVKFSAEWCGPCKAVAPVIENISKDYLNEMKFVEVDIDTSPKIAEDQGIRGVPTFLVFRDGKVFSRDVGGHSRTQLVELIESGIEGEAA